MSCSRCAGCMVEDFLLDMEDSSGPMWLQAWRCMNCGNIHDSVLQQNRTAQETRILAASAITQRNTTQNPPPGTTDIGQLAA